jgi:pyrimidine operon attenuation protein/uracil phosphoribosyltransferase
MKILNHQQIRQKIKRLAIEILEQNFKEESLILAGINNNGVVFAKMLIAELEQITSIPLILTRIVLTPANPVSQPISIEMPVEELEGKAIIIVDDVANTGRTAFYATRPILDTLPKKLEVAVLVDRTHKSFPIQVDYVGLSLATTLKENIEVHIKDPDDYAVYLR